MRYREDDSYRTISLPNDSICLVSAEDYWWLSCLRWMVSSMGDSGKGYIVEMEWRILMHRMVLGISSEEIADHVNGNTFDNRRENLRVCTRAQNTYNQPSRGGASKYKGVYRSGQTGNWFASISFNYKRISLGSYSNEVDAAIAYDEGAKKYHGGFARLNFPYGRTQFNCHGNHTISPVILGL